MAVTTFEADDAATSGESHPTTIVAVHGLTGHGRRWADLAENHMSDLRVVAPDLLGHGFSSSAAPWTIERQVQALVEVFDNYVDGPTVVVGHSFGAALAVHLATVIGDRVAGLVLLDPAVEIDGQRAADAAEDTVETWYVRDADEARERKRAEAWWEVPDAVLDAEIDAHLIPAGDDGWRWRLHRGAIVATWSELARPHVLPPAGTPTAMVIADKVQPPYASPAFVAGMVDRLGDDLTLVHEDCDHMVPLSRPELTASLVRSVLSRITPGD